MASDHGSRPVGMPSRISWFMTVCCSVRPDVDGRRFAGDRDRFGQGADFELDVDGRHKRGADGDLGALDRLEALKLELHVVGAGRQPIEAVRAARIGTPWSAVPPINRSPVSVTVTPGMTAPLVSLTAPTIEPVCWAKAFAPEDTKSKQSKTLRSIVMFILARTTQPWADARTIRVHTRCVKRFRSSGAKPDFEGTGPGTNDVTDGLDRGSRPVLGGNSDAAALRQPRHSRRRTRTGLSHRTGRCAA